jgi:hypothetical protein
MAAITADDHAYSGLPNKLVSAANGVEYAYRDAGEGRGGVPLVLLNHFRGNQHHAEFAADVETFLSEPR